MKNHSWLLLATGLAACAPAESIDSSEQASSCPITLPRCHPQPPPPPPITLALDHVEPAVLEEGGPVTVFFTAKNVSATARNGWIGVGVTPPGGAEGDTNDTWQVVQLQPNQTMSGALCLTGPPAALANQITLFYFEQWVPNGELQIPGARLASFSFTADTNMRVSAGLQSIIAKLTNQWHTDDDHASLSVYLSSATGFGIETVYQGAERDLGHVSAGGAPLVANWTSTFDLLPTGPNVNVQMWLRTTGDIPGCNWTAQYMGGNARFTNAALLASPPGTTLLKSDEDTPTGSNLCGSGPDYVYVFEAIREKPSFSTVTPRHAKLSWGPASFHAVGLIHWSVDGYNGSIDPNGHYTPPPGGLPYGSMAVVRATAGAWSGVAVVEP